MKAHLTLRYELVGVDPAGTWTRDSGGWRKGLAWVPDVAVLKAELLSETPSVNLTCDACGKSARSPAGLELHKRRWCNGNSSTQ